MRWGGPGCHVFKLVQFGVARIIDGETIKHHNSENWGPVKSTSSIGSNYKVLPIG